MTINSWGTEVVHDTLIVSIDNVIDTGNAPINGSTYSELPCRIVQNLITCKEINKVKSYFECIVGLYF